MGSILRRASPTKPPHTSSNLEACLQCGTPNFKHGHVARNFRPAGHMGPVLRKRIFPKICQPGHRHTKTAAKLGLGEMGQSKTPPNNQGICAAGTVS